MKLNYCPVTIKPEDNIVAIPVLKKNTKTEAMFLCFEDPS